jgi:hypothetical protein
VKMPTVNKPGRRRPRSEDVAYVKHSVARATGLKIDLNRLDADEVYELRGLVDAIRASADEGTERSNPSALDDLDKLKSWEALAAKAAGKPSEFFDKQREHEASAAAEAAQARKPSPHPKLMEAGAIELPAGVFLGVQDGELPALHLLLIVIVMSAIQNKAPLHPHMRIDGDTVVVPSPEHLVAPLDLDGNINGVASALRDLGDAGVLVVERHGEVRISLGDVLRAAA